jgi:cysteinyl-tRNA synthetase
VNVSDTIVQNAQAEINKILLAMRQASLQLQLSSIDISNHHAKAPEYFLTTLADDLNTANALTRVLESIKDLNEELRKKPFNLNSVSSVFFTLQAMLSILGLDLNLTILNADDKQLYANYLKAKELKQFNQSDAFRKILIDRHIL